MKTKPKRSKVSKTLQNYILFQEELEEHLKENRPEQFVKAIVVFFEVVDFEIIENLRDFAKTMSLLAREFIKALNNQPFDELIVERFRNQKAEFKNIVEIFMHNYQFVS